MKKVSFDEFKEVFYGMADSERFDLWNKVCDENNFESRLFQMADLDEIVGEKAPTELIGILDDKFSLTDEYFYYDGYGRLHSVDSTYKFFENECGDDNEVFRYLSNDEDEMRKFMEENDPDFDESEWEDEE